MLMLPNFVLMVMLQNFVSMHTWFIFVWWSMWIFVTLCYYLSAFLFRTAQYVQLLTEPCSSPRWHGPRWRALGKILGRPGLDGHSVSEIAHNFYACIPKRRRRSRTVADGLLGHSWARDIHCMIGIKEIGEYLLLWLQLEHIHLSDQADTLILSSDGIFSAKSSCKATFHGSTYCSAWKLIWKTRVRSV